MAASCARRVALCAALLLCLSSPALAKTDQEVRDHLKSAFANLPPGMMDQMGAIKKKIDELPPEQRLPAMEELTEKMGYNKACKPAVKCAAGSELVPKSIMLRSAAKCKPFTGMYEMVTNMAIQEAKEKGEPAPELPEDQTCAADDDTCEQKISIVELFAPCCTYLHACYQTCGQTSAQCNRRFKACSKAVCEAIGDAEDASVCDYRVGLLYDGVRMARCTSFDAGQKHNCECAPSEEASSRRATTLRSFYAEHNNENIFTLTLTST